MLAETLFFFLFSFFHTVNLPCGSYHYFATSFNTKKNWRSTNRLWYNYKNEEKLLRLIIGFLGACRNNKGQPILILLRGQFYNTQVLHTHTQKKSRGRWGAAQLKVCQRQSSWPLPFCSIHKVVGAAFYHACANLFPFRMNMHNVAGCHAQGGSWRTTGVPVPVETSTSLSGFFLAFCFQMNCDCGLQLLKISRAY